MRFRPVIALAACAVLFGAAAPARADNAELLGALIKWSAIVQHDAGALGTAVDRGPAAADAAALKLRSDSRAATDAIDAVSPSSPLGAQVRDQVATALRNYQRASGEIHLAVGAAVRNDSKGATSHMTKALAAAKLGGSQLTRASKLLAKLKV